MVELQLCCIVIEMIFWFFFILFSFLLHILWAQNIVLLLVFCMVNEITVIYFQVFIQVVISMIGVSISVFRSILFLPHACNVLTPRIESLIS